MLVGVKQLRINTFYFLLFLTLYSNLSKAMASSKLFISKRALIGNDLKPAGVLVKDGKIDKVIVGDDFSDFKADIEVSLFCYSFVF